MSFEAKIADLYKFLSEGWSIVLSESRAGVGIGSKDYLAYKESEHYNRVRRMYGKKAR